jgi:hypothetical protein
MVRAAILLVWLGALSLSAADVLGDFRPSPSRSVYGAISNVEFSTELIELDAGVLAFHPDRAMRDFFFAEPVWIIGYQTEVLDGRNSRPRENYLCHTFFGDQRVTQHDDREMLALYSDAFTPQVRLPDGFGFRMAAGESIHWMPLFNNRQDEPVRIRIKGVISVIREKDLSKAMRPLYSTLRSVNTPHLFFVKPGRHEFQKSFQAPFDGRIHFMGTHIHPYGVSVELYDVTNARMVWRSTRRLDNAGQMIGMDTFDSGSGYAVKAGDMFRITAVYDNPTSAPIDAMAGLFISYSRN